MLNSILPGSDFELTVRYLLFHFGHFDNIVNSLFGSRVRFFACHSCTMDVSRVTSLVRFLEWLYISRERARWNNKEVKDGGMIIRGIRDDDFDEEE